MKYQHFYTPTDYTTITPEMVKRWMAMEARLEAEIERLQQIIEEDLYSEYSILDFKADLEMLEGIRNG